MHDETSQSPVKYICDKISDVVLGDLFPRKEVQFVV